jgi:hypothetical protein
LTLPDPRRGVVPHPDEPAVVAWRPVPFADVVAGLLARAGAAGRPAVLGVDGRSAGGKSTLAARIAAHVPGAALVHTDDVAWYESFFGWDTLLADHVLEPARRGEPVRYRPSAWDVRGREGAIEVPAGVPLVVVEGVGATRRSLAPLLDAAVWVQSDAVLARRRGIERDLSQRPEPAVAEAFWDEWEAQEAPFLAADRPWTRADVIVCGTPDRPVASQDVLVGVLPA